MAGDVVSLTTERPAGEPLLHPVMRDGQRLSGLLELDANRGHAREQLALLPGPLARLEPFDYPVEISAGLRQMAAELDRRSESGM